LKTSRIVLALAALTLGVVLFALADDYLHSGDVQPDSGPTSQLFTYWVSWSGPMDPPTAYVHIDDLGAVMMDYVHKIDDDHMYKYSTKLPTGDHAFHFSDSMGGEDPNGELRYVGPTVF